MFVLELILATLQACSQAELLDEFLHRECTNCCGSNTHQTNHLRRQHY